MLQKQTTFVAYIVPEHHLKNQSEQKNT